MKLLASYKRRHHFFYVLLFTSHYVIADSSLGRKKTAISPINRIVGENEASPNRYSDFTRLDTLGTGVSSDGKQHSTINIKCGGILIYPDFVLTAERCVVNRPEEDSNSCARLLAFGNATRNTVDATGSRDTDGEIDVLQSSGGTVKSSGLSPLLISERHWNIAVENDLAMLQLGRPIFDVDPILPNSVAAEIPVTYDKVRTNGLGCVEESCLSLASRVQQVDDLKTRFQDCYDTIKGGTLVFLTIQ